MVAEITNLYDWKQRQALEHDALRDEITIAHWNGDVDKGKALLLEYIRKYGQCCYEV